jgi:hypothetical protein
MIPLKLYNSLIMLQLDQIRTCSPKLKFHRLLAENKSTQITKIFQFSYNRFNGLPKFLGVQFWSGPASPPTYNSFLEGWGLYSEQLGRELNLYEEDPYQVINNERTKCEKSF